RQAGSPFGGFAEVGEFGGNVGADAGLEGDVHVVSSFDDTRAVEWFAAMDYGFTHYTVVLLGCVDGDGTLFIVDEHAERLWLPQRHAPAIKAMLARHGISLSDGKDAFHSVPYSSFRPL